jgi:hypothetical protein
MAAALVLVQARVLEPVPALTKWRQWTTKTFPSRTICPIRTARLLPLGLLSEQGTELAGTYFRSPENGSERSSIKF